MSALVVIGDCLLDRDVDGHVDRVMPDAPAPVLDEGRVQDRAGGAGLAATLAAGDGHAVTLVTALGRDDAGSRARTLLEQAGVQVVDLGLDAPTPVKTRLRADGHPLLRLDHGQQTVAVHVGRVPPGLPRRVAGADAILVSCYGRGITAHEGVRALVRHVLTRRPVVWDPHPRGAPPLPGTTIVTPNARELADLVPDEPGEGMVVDTRRARALASRWSAGVAVTRGADGALFTAAQGMALVVPAPKVEAGDVCGAGDRFAAAVTGALADGHGISDAVRSGVEAASAFVEAGGAAGHAAVAADRPRTRSTPSPKPAASEDAIALADRVRRAGGTVVATGGCFDILHLGHADLLAAARSLGDCLVVCLNSDDSVRRLKGAGRPVVTEADRAAMLCSLRDVDAVLVFDEDTPAEALRRLRPDVFVKGGDYAGQPIIEADVVAAWGGQAVTVPYRPGRSTTRILQEVLDHD